MCFILLENFDVLNSGANYDSTDGNETKINRKYVWDKTLHTDYIKNLFSDETINNLNNITDKFCAECSISDIDENISNFVSALFYRNIASFEQQFYLDAVTVRKWRVALSRLRVSSHRLGIETGRWGRNRVAITHRKCHLCNILEDEYHFIFECPAYNEIRNQYIPRYYRIRPNMYKCTELLMTKSKSKIRNLACYIYKAFEIRNSIVYNH